MIIIALILTILGLILNLSCPADLTNTPAFVLILEYIAVLFFAKRIIDNKIKSNNTDREKFYAFFLLGFAFSLFVLHFLWTPGLSDTNPQWGFDPQRYYKYASVMLKGDFVADGLNYWGVVLFYYFSFFLFGLNPLIPLYINVLLVLYATTLMANFLNGIEGVNVKYKTSAYLLLIPEVICYNVMSSREILVMTFGTIAILNAYKILQGDKSKLLSLFTVLSLLIMIAIRPPYGICALLLIGVYYLFGIRKRKKRNKFPIIAFALIGVVGLSVVNMAGSLGDNEDIGTSLSETIGNRVGGTNVAGDDLTYQANSISARLIPHNPVEFVIFGVIRTFAYLVLPPANFFNPIAAFDVFTDYGGFTEWTTLFMMLLIPTVYKITRRYYGKREEINLLIIAFLAFFFLVGMFNVNLIQMRYRLVYDLFYFSLAITMLTIQKSRRRKDRILK